MEFKVLSVLKKFIPEEQFETLKDELGKFEGELNTDITKYITSNTPDKDSLLKDAKALAHLEVIKELGIKGVETVEQLNSHIETVKLSSTEQAQELTRLETELGRVTGEYETEVATRTKKDAESKLSNELGLIKGLNINKYDLEDEDAVEFLHSKLSKLVNEEATFEEVVGTYQEENKPEERTRFIDPRMVKQKIANPNNEDGFAIYQQLKKEGKI